MSTNITGNLDILRNQITDALKELERKLPNQAPLLEFVHFNILEGYQHLPFPVALKAAHRSTGQLAYLPDQRFRSYYHAGRITLEDIHDSLNNTATLNAGDEIGSGLWRRDIYVATMLHPIKPLTGYQLNWQIDHQGALQTIQADVPATVRRKLLAGKSAADNGQGSETSATPDDLARAEARCVQNLWESCLQALGLSHEYIHPEELVDLEAERTVTFLRAAATRHDAENLHQQMRNESLQLFDEMSRAVGDTLTLRGFLKAITGHDLLDEIRPLLLPHLASHLDQGMAAWHNPDRSQGLYKAWRSSALTDLAWAFEEMPDWRDDITDLPDNALDTIIFELHQLGIPPARSGGYLQCLALELPGWSSMMLWRDRHPGYQGQQQPVEMLDYLALRLVLERLYGNRLCRRLWQIQANLDTLRWYFHRRRSEFFVRHALFNRRLPEYLVNLVQNQLNYFQINPGDYTAWPGLADIIMTWLHSPMSASTPGYSLLSHAWPLFRLAQHLGLDADAIAALNSAQIDSLFDCLDRLDADTRGYVWLQAFERHYREQLFAALLAHRHQGRWKYRGDPRPPPAHAAGSPSSLGAAAQAASPGDRPRARPDAQLVFCMDDREEGIRRHLEEHNPHIETLGAAGFFGVAISYTGLDDLAPAPLCPVVVTPAHKIDEIPQPDQMQQLGRHRVRRARRIHFRELLHQHSRRSVLTPLIVSAAAPLSLLALLARSFAHSRFGRLSNRLRSWFDGQVKTTLTLQADAANAVIDASPNRPRQGFTDSEQADRVFNFLRNINLQQGLAPFVVMVGHGSISQNNPHMAAYDCGACSGRHGGPNARAFAAMANRPEIRALLRDRGLQIPDDTWFLGAEHNTCDETMVWYDTEQIPVALQPAFAQLHSDVLYGCQGSAHERCRRLMSAPQNASLQQSLAHIAGRATDYSQARPELGHMNHAAAIIGRRAISQGLFLDRRVFLISYNPLSDVDGAVLESFLGLNAQVVSTFLDYYFSTVNNSAYGSGSKITHNATGLFGVMDGCSSDLRTGLAQQMVEIHEPMRPHVLVEAHTEVLTQIYGRQPLLQELIGNRWLLLSAIHPDTGDISTFNPDTGFSPWQGEIRTLPIVSRSADWYAGHEQPLPPAQVKQEGAHA